MTQSCQTIMRLVSLVASLFRGRPSGLSVLCNPKRWAVSCCHAAAPNGVPRRTARRNAANSPAVSTTLTCSRHSKGRSTVPLVQKVQTTPSTPACQTRPRPCFGLRHQVGTRWVAFDVAADAEEMFVLLNGEGLEAPLVERPGAAGVVVGVPAHGMRQGQPVQEVGQVAVVVRPEDEMEVVGHEAIGQQPHGPCILGLSEDAFKGGVVGVFVEVGGATATARLRTW